MIMVDFMDVVDKATLNIIEIDFLSKNAILTISKTNPERGGHE
jgi:hypothetical protein